jgi:hypothetical protein
MSATSIPLRCRLVAMVLFGLGGLALAAAPEMVVRPVEILQFSPKKSGEQQISAVRGDLGRETSSMVMKMGRGAFLISTDSDWAVLLSGHVRSNGKNSAFSTN